MTWCYIFTSLWHLAVKGLMLIGWHIRDVASWLTLCMTVMCQTRQCIMYPTCMSKTINLFQYPWCFGLFITANWHWDCLVYTLIYFSLLMLTNITRTLAIHVTHIVNKTMVWVVCPLHIVQIQICKSKHAQTLIWIVWSLQPQHAFRLFPWGVNTV